MNIFASIYLVIHLTKAAELLKYKHTVRVESCKVLGGKQIQNCGSYTCPQGSLNHHQSPQAQSVLTIITKACAQKPNASIYTCALAVGVYTPKLTATSLASSSHTMGKDKMPLVLTPQTSQAQQTKNFNFKTQHGHKSPVSPKDSVMGEGQNIRGLGKTPIKVSVLSKYLANYPNKHIANKLLSGFSE